MMTRANAASPRAVLLLLILPGFAVGQGGRCELCRQFHAAQAPVYVTDWETNQLHRLGDLDCALRAMHTRFAWSRAALIDAGTGERITVTRAQGRWTVRPEGSVVVVRSADASGCAGYNAYSSRDEFLRYTKKHRKSAQPGPAPESLADFVDATIGRLAGGSAGSVASQPAALAAAPVADRPAPGWSADAVDVAQAEGIMEGYPDGTFRGDGQVTRYEMAVIAQRLLERLGRAAKLGMGGPGDMATSQDLVEALEDDLAAAGADRGEVAEALQVLDGAAADGVTVPPATAANSDWPDVPGDHWASEAVVAVTGAGLMNGYPDSTFQGDRALTRYEIAVIASRLLGLARSQPAPATPLPQPQPESQPVPPEPAGVQPAPQPAVTPGLSNEARAHLLGLKSQLMLSGMTEERADQALAPVRDAMLQGRPVVAPTDLAGPPSTTPAPGVDPGKPPTVEATVPPERTERTNPTVAEPNMLGVSGFLLTPSADTVPRSDTVKIGLSRVLGSNVAFGTTGAVDDFELGMAVTSGDMPSRILLSGKKQVWRSGDGRSRVAVGILDATDEIDTTVYGAYSKSFQSSFWTDEDHDWTLTVGLGGGDLLDGIFASAYAPVNEKLSVGAEVVDFGDAGNQLNFGFEYRLGRGWQIKGGMVDGDLSAQAMIEMDL